MGPTLLLFLLLDPWIVPGGRCSDDDAFEQACVRGDRDAVARHARDLRNDLPRSPDSARLHYLLGLSELLSCVCTNGNPDRRDPERLAAALEEAARRLVRARELAPHDGDVHAAIALLAWMQFALPDPDTARLAQEVQRALTEGERAAPEHAYLGFLRIASGLSGPDPSRQLVTLEDDALSLAEGIEQRFLDGDRETMAFWDLMALGMLGRSFVFLTPPRPDVAHHFTQLTLELEPGFAMARDFLLPFVTPRTPMERGEFAGREWSLAAEDAADDGQLAGLPDATGLLVSSAEDALWVRVPLAAAPDASAFGVNLVIEAPGSSDETGRERSGLSPAPADSTPWWGGNPLRFSRLVTVWVARGEDDQYRGAVGVADHRPAYEGVMTGLAEGTVGFAVDLESPAFVLRVPWDDMAVAGPLRFVAAVGSNAQWNDDVPDAGAVEVTRAPFP